jgi:hypothetical protein
MNDLMKWVLFTIWNGKPKELQIKDYCHEPYQKPLARNDRFCFQKFKKKIGTLVHIQENFCQISEVDQGLEYEV